MKNKTLSCVTLGNVNLKYNEYRLQREIKRCPQHLDVPGDLCFEKYFNDSHLL